jgi:hypothetical protein
MANPDTCDLLVADAKNTCQDQGAKVVKTAVRMGNYADEILEAADEMIVLEPHYVGNGSAVYSSRT